MNFEILRGILLILFGFDFCHEAYKGCLKGYLPYERRGPKSWSEVSPIGFWLVVCWKLIAGICLVGFGLADIIR